MAAVTCYSVIEQELAKGPRTEATLIAKCEEYGFDARGVRVALTRGSNAGRFNVDENDAGKRTYSKAA
jgi:DNA-binding transcriptional regulator PaaX